MELHWPAVLLSALIVLLMGFIWYHPKVLGTRWMEESGTLEEKMRNSNMGLIFGSCYLMGVFIALFLSAVVQHGGEEFHTFRHGAFHGALAGLTFALPILGIPALFERRSMTYILIHAGYWVLTLALMGGVLCLWRA